MKKIMLLGATHSLTTFIFLLSATLLCALGLPRLRIETGFNNLIPAHSSDKQAYDRIAGEFGSDNKILVYIHEDNLWTPDKLAALERLHNALTGLDFVERVDDFFTLRNISGRAGAIRARLFMRHAPEDQPSADRALKEALENPIIYGNFISGDGSVVAMQVALRHGLDDDQRINALLEQTLAPYQDQFQQLFQVGGPRINDELQGILLSDIRLLGPASALTLVFAILVFMRSITAAFVPLITSAVSLVWTFGLMGWLGIPVNILTAMLPSLIVAIGSTEDVHMVEAYVQGLAIGGQGERTSAVLFMMRQLGAPLLLTILTTALGFASNMLSNIGLIHDFAIASTLAMLSNGMITLLLVPILLRVIGPRRRRGGKAREAGVTGRLAGALDRFRHRYPGMILLITGILCAFFIFEASKLHVSNDPMSYFRQDRPLLRQLDEIHRRLSGAKVFFITLESDRVDAFQRPENIEKLVNIQRFMQRQGIFDRSISLADQLALMNREFHGGHKSYFKTPHSRALIAQYLLFFHRKDLENYVSHDFRRANIVVRYNISDSYVLNRHIDELREVVAHIAGNDMKSWVVGENLLINAATEGLLTAQIKSLGILLLVIFLLMSAMFTSFKGGIISLIPNMIPIILMFGLMKLCDISLNPGTAMVAVISIGIAIDGTIHLLSRYNILSRQTSDYDQAVAATIEAEAAPMIITSLALALGFGILLLSDFALIAQFGALSAATMLFALFANLVITPILMSRIRLVSLHQILGISRPGEALLQSPLFKDMSYYQICKAILISQAQTFDSHALLVKQGSFGRSMYLVLSGRVEVVRRDRHHKGQRLATLAEGQIFGEVGFVREAERMADVRALSKVEVLKFDFEKLEKDLKFFPRIIAKLNFNISRILGERLADMVHGLPSQGPVTLKKR
jgi:predicted RND superfamily exporter protein